MEFDKEHGVSGLFQAQCHIYRHMYHYIESMSLRCVVQLGIPDIIHKHGKPITLLELVSALQVPPSKANCLQRFMRILVHAGFFATAKIQENEEEKEEGYVLTDVSKMLLRDSSVTLSPAVRGLLHPVLVNSWFSLGDWLRDNKSTPFETHHGTSFFDYAKQNHEFIDSVNKAMASDSRLASLVVRNHLEIFEGAKSVVDVGGGTGTLSRAIAEALPHLKCTVLDLPRVVANLPEGKNLKFVGGDMFQSVPSADIIIIKSVLHNWSDGDCVKVLKRCREAIPREEEAGKVILLEMVIDNNDKEGESEQRKTRMFVDMQMMVLCNGWERNEKEWENLFLEAGFTHYKITPTSGLNSIIEVYP